MAAWFWFTVMSTVGYGNYVPTTVWGRLVTCGFGFISILMFGGMLGTAGGITVHIVNDMVRRCKRNVSKPIMVMLWGTFWLLWMLVISHQAMSYQEKRLQEEFAMNDAYWFAFVSTTTIGFGDYYLQPEGLFISDLLGLWGNFLMGFILLSAFLNELSQMLVGHIPNLVDDLQQNLKYADDVSARQQGSHRRREAREQDEARPTPGFSHPILGGVQQPEKAQSPDNNSAPIPIKAAEPAIIKTEVVEEKGSEIPTGKQDAELKPVDSATSVATQKVATFSNTGSDPTMATAELYYNTSRWGPLGHGDNPIAVSTYPGDEWYIVANGVYAKLFKIGDDDQQQFTI